MWLVAAILDSTGQKWKRVNSPVVSSLWSPSFPTLYSVPRAVLAAGRNQRLRSVVLGNRRTPAVNSLGIEGDAFKVVENSCLFAFEISGTHSYSLVYVINLLCETCFVNQRSALVWLLRINEVWPDLSCCVFLLGSVLAIRFWPKLQAGFFSFS